MTRLLLALAFVPACGACGCTTPRPSVADAAAYLAEAGGPPPGVAVYLDGDTRVLYVDGARSGRLGLCRELPGGVRELTIYVARHWDGASLRATIEHELGHARRTCSPEDHS